MWRPDGEVRAGQWLAHVRAHVAGQAANQMLAEAEVQQINVRLWPAACLYQYVGRFDVTVNNATLMYVTERPRDGIEDLPRNVGRETPPCNQRLYGRPAHQRHHKIAQVAALAII